MTLMNSLMAKSRRLKLDSLAFASLLALIFAISMMSAQAQSVYSPGGLFIHPTAYTAPSHQFSVYAAAFTQDEESGRSQAYFPLALTYAPTDKLQVSALAVYHEGKNAAPYGHFGAFVKYQLLSDTRSHPAFALSGAYVANDELESSIAGVFSRAFTRQGRLFATLHLGVKWGRSSDGNGGANDFGGFVGAQIPLSREWNLVGETSSRLKFDRASASSVGFMYQTRKGFGISLGLVNSGRSSRMNPFFGVGIPVGN